MQAGPGYDTVLAEGDKCEVWRYSQLARTGFSKFDAMVGAGGRFYMYSDVG